MDDFLVTGHIEKACEHNVQRFIDLLHAIGWLIAMDKLDPPSQRFLFLGIIFDSRKMSMGLEALRLEIMLSTIRAYLAAGQATVEDLSSLAGHLQHIQSYAIKGGAHIYPIYLLLSESTMPFHMVSLSPEVVADLQWWEAWLATMLAAAEATDDKCWSRVFHQAPTKLLRSFSDASGSKGFAIMLADTVICGQWDDPDARLIEAMELVPLLIAVSELGQELSDCVLVYSTDNIGVATSLNKGSSRSSLMRQLLRVVMDAAADQGMAILGDHLPREYNVLADAMSKGADYMQPRTQGISLLL